MNEFSNFFAAVRSELSGPELQRILGLRSTETLKSDGSYVTRGDLLMQEILMRIARECVGDVTFVSEEMSNSVSDASQAAALVVIDPIDGTENYTSGFPIWGVSISCFAKLKHRASLLGCPELGLWAMSGDTPPRGFRSRIRGLSSSLSKNDISDATAGFEYRIFGCCVFNMLSVLRGSLQSFENPKGAWPWDILAGLNLALEAGLDVKVEGECYAGQYLAPDRRYRFKIEQR